MADFPIKTYPQLDDGVDFASSDIIARYRSPGPLKRATAGALAAYMASSGGLAKADLSNFVGPLSVAQGGTNGTTQATARTGIGAASQTDMTTAQGQITTLSGQVSSLSNQVSGIQTTGSTPWPTAAAGVSKGVKSLASLVAGSGGTNGTFALGFSGGAGTGATGVFTVAGGAVTSYVITYSGYGYTSAPTVSFAASSGLTGASATAVIADNTANGQEYNVSNPSAAVFVDVYKNNAGTPLYVKTLYNGAPAPTYQFGQADFDYISRNGYPLNYFQVWASTLGSCTRDSTTGIITIPPGAVYLSENWNAADIGMSTTGPVHPFYAVAPEGSDVTLLKLEALGNSGTVLFTGQVQDFPKVQTARLLFQNSIGGSPSGTIRLRITNTSGSVPSAFYKPEFYQADATYLPKIERYDEKVPVYWPTIAPNEPWLKWSTFDYAQHRQQEASCTYAADFNDGLNTNSGSIILPKKDLTSLPAWTNQQTYGLARGSVWNQSIPANTSNSYVAVVDVGRNSQNLPTVSGADAILTGSWTNVGGSVWETTVTLQANPGSGLDYDQVIVYALNSSTVAATPIASRSQLEPAATGVTTPVAAGTVSVAYTGSGTNYRVRIWGPDSAAPGTLYNYEIAVRDAPAYIGVRGDKARQMLSGLNLICGYDGLGALVTSCNFVGDRLVVQGATTHAMGISGGSLTRSVIIANGAKPTGKTGIPNGANGVTFYTAAGAGFSWFAKGLMVWGIESPFYAHTSGNSYDVGYVEDFVAIGQRRGGGLYGAAFACQNTAKVDLFANYVENFNFTQGLTGVPTTTNYHIARNVSRNVIQGTGANNVTTTINGAVFTSDGLNQVMYYFASGASRTSDLIIANTIVPGNGQNDYVVTLYGPHASGGGLVMGAARGNTYVLNNTLNNKTSMAAAGATLTTSIANTALVNSDWSVYVMTTTGALSSGSGGSLGTTFAQWQTNSGQDANSLFIDLRDDPRGLKAIWVDPDNGDFSPAQTRVAAQYKAFYDACPYDMPPMYSRFPSIPTQDNAARYVQLA